MAIFYTLVVIYDIHIFLDPSLPEFKLKMGFTTVGLDWAKFSGRFVEVAPWPGAAAGSGRRTFQKVFNVVQTQLQPYACSHESIEPKLVKKISLKSFFKSSYNVNSCSTELLVKLDPK